MNLGGCWAQSSHIYPHLAICKITSGLCALICTFKPECRYGSLILIQSISLTSFFQPCSCWGDLRLGTSREMCQTSIERQLVYISQGCGNQIVRQPCALLPDFRRQELLSVSTMPCRWSLHCWAETLNTRVYGCRWMSVRELKNYSFLLNCRHYMISHN